jgi:hypothetical protein
LATFATTPFIPVARITLPFFFICTSNLTDFNFSISILLQVQFLKLIAFKEIYTLIISFYLLNIFNTQGEFHLFLMFLERLAEYLA